MCFENVPYKAFYSGKMGFGAAPRRCGIHSKFQPLLQNTCISYVSKTLVAYEEMCLRMHALALVRRPRITLVILFPKIDFFYLKGCIFHFNTL